MEGSKGFLSLNRTLLRELESGIYSLKWRGSAGWMLCADGMSADDQCLDRVVIDSTTAVHIERRSLNEEAYIIF